MRMLLCCDGSPHMTRGVEFGARVARSMATHVDVLAVSAQGSDAAVRRIAEQIATELQDAGIPVLTLWKRGRLAEEVVQQTRAAPYDLVVIGSRGRRGFLRLLLGSVALYVSEHAPASVLVVKGRVRDPERLLVCTAAGPASDETALFSWRFAKALGASVSFLHVMSQLPLTPGAVTDDLEASADDLIKCQSREGMHLSRMLQLMAEQGHSARAVVRHGLVLDEIAAEVRDGGYDMLVIGAHATPGLRPHLLDNLSADILLSVDCPVVVVGHGQTPKGEESS